MKVQIEFEVTDAFKQRCLEHKLAPSLIAEEAIYWFQSKEPSMVTEIAVDCPLVEHKTYYKIK